MLLPDDIRPEDSIYYNGAIVLKILQMEKKLSIMDLYCRLREKNKITFAVTPDGREHVISLSLNKLEEELDPELFFRVNRQIIINIDSIDKAIPYFKGKIKLIIRPKYSKEIIISEHKSQLFRQWLNH